MRWNLDSLYTSFDSKKFEKDYENLIKEIELAKVWAAANLSDSNSPIEKLEYFINKQNYINDLYWSLFAYSVLIFRADTKNKRAIQMREDLQQKKSEFLKSTTAFEKWTRSLQNLKELISESKLLEEHSFYLNNIAEGSKYSLSEKEEVAIAIMKSTGSNAWNRLYSQLTSSLLIDINVDGKNKKLTLPVINRMLSDKDEETRKNAYLSRIKAYKKIEDTAAACLNGIKGEFINISKIRGYETPLQHALADARIDMETLDAMFDAIKKSLPSLRKYFYKKAELMLHKNGLPVYDLTAPIGNIDIRFTYEEAKDCVINSFTSFSDKLADFAKMAFDKKWIDAEPRQGKVRGGSCLAMPWIKESRILMSFSGEYNNTITLGHELGHAYHGSCLNNETHLNSWYTLPIGETASIFCETLVKNEMLKKASQKDMIAMLEADLRDTAGLILSQCSYFTFENEVFKRREEALLSVEEIKEIELSSKKLIYKDSVDFESDDSYKWLIPHFYLPKYHYYNYPYIFGLLFSKGLYAEYLKRGEEFIRDFDKLLAASGKMQNADLAMLMGIDIHSIDFWSESLKMIEADVEKFVEL